MARITMCARVRFGPFSCVSAASASPSYQGARWQGADGPREHRASQDLAREGRSRCAPAKMIIWPGSSCVNHARAAPLSGGAAAVLCCRPTRMRSEWIVDGRRRREVGGPASAPARVPDDGGRIFPAHRPWPRPGPPRHTQARRSRRHYGAHSAGWLAGLRFLRGREAARRGGNKLIPI
jgi:hypothetical protein